ncbi:MAG: sigma 54-interacting transcriptional regulator [Pseudomonadota bacterium]
MTAETPLDFTPEEWEFLAAFALFDRPAEVDLTAAISPLSPGRIVRTIEQAATAGLLDRGGPGVYGFSRNQPPRVLARVREINLGPARLKSLVRVLDEFAAWPALSSEYRIELLQTAGRTEEAALLLAEQGRRAIDDRSPDRGYQDLLAALELFAAASRTPASAAIHISAALDFSSLSFSLGRDLGLAERHLSRARELAQAGGDLRSQALIGFHLGRIYYLGDRRRDALEAFRESQGLVEDLGDEDIRIQAAEFIGMNYFALGFHGEAVEHLDRAAQAFETRGMKRLINPSAPLYLGYCASYLGQFHRAVGGLDSAWRSARRDEDKSLSSLYRAALGTVLLQIGRIQEGFQHITAALGEAEAGRNALAKYSASGGLAYYHFIHHRFKEARDILAGLIREGAAAGIRRQFASPYVLEMLFEFERHGLAPIPGFGFPDQADRLTGEPSVHLQGVAWRLLARERLINGDHSEAVSALLEKSEKCLTRSGDPIQLAQTRVEMARLALGRGDLDQARRLALKARRGLSGHSEAFFPDELRALLQDFDPARDGPLDAEAFDQQLGMIVGSIPHTSLQDNLDYLVRELNRLLGAERGALFWAEDETQPDLTLKIGKNFSEADALKPAFARYRTAIDRVFRQNQPEIERNRPGGRKPEAGAARSVLRLPLVVNGLARGVLHYDNSYLTDFLAPWEESLPLKLTREIGPWIGRVIQFTGALEETRRSVLEISARRESVGRDEIIGGRSPAMREALNLADKAARSDGSILIQGETGVGKELLAARIHEKSPRSRRPFVTVDPTTIPETLAESELFGYEKGAFTGAETRKAGRVELAHLGTLFIDEIAEIPLNAQAKLLRVLQEKTFVRIGGTKPQQADFRLIVATNRDLESEVKAGRFRRDLFYRLNTITLQLPPLRERREDAVLLARYFLARFAKKYNRPDLELGARDEKLVRDHNWPGNVRELKNVMESAVILGEGRELGLKIPLARPAAGWPALDDEPTLEEVQRRYITRVLGRTGGRIGGPGGAAEILGLKRTSLYTRMKRLGLTRPA